MKWLFKEPVAGDMIRVSFGDFWHFGIYVSDGEVIQFGLAPPQRPTIPDSEIEVLSSDIDAFLAGGFLEVAEFDKKESKKNRKPAEVIAFARSKLGMRGYNILYNNCEHFAMECITGERFCAQTEKVRALFRSMPLADVYVAKIPQDGKIGEVIPKRRQEDILAATNPRVKAERYYVWRLLEYALERSLGLKMKKLSFTKAESGKWSSPSCEFSLSHSDGAVAVAVSRAPIGIDLEPVDKVHPEGLSERVLTARELAEFCALDAAKRNDYLTARWTAKEAVFKRGSEPHFEPGRIEVASESVRTLTVDLDGRQYTVSVATATPERIKLHETVDLTR